MILISLNTWIYPTSTKSYNLINGVIWYWSSFVCTSLRFCGYFSTMNQHMLIYKVKSWWLILFKSQLYWYKQILISRKAQWTKLSDLVERNTTTGIIFNAALINTAENLEETLVTPVSVPRVCDQPVLLTLFDTITNDLQNALILKWVLLGVYNIDCTIVRILP